MSLSTTDQHSGKISWKIDGAQLTVTSGVAYAQADKYYVLAEKNEVRKWEFKKIALEKPSWEKKTQEIFEIGRHNGKELIPSYEETSEWKYLGNYSYKQFSDEPSLTSAITYSCKMRSDETKYTPCNSSLTSFINTDFFGILGSSRFSLNANRLKSVIKEANLVSEVIACREKNLSFAEDALRNRIHVEPVVVDASGYYDNSKLYDVVPENYDCFISGTNDIKYTFDTKAASKYNLKFDKSAFPICQNGGTCKFAPSIKVISMNVPNLKVNDTFADNAVAVKIEEVSQLDKSQIEMTYAFSNISRSVVKIESISLYVDDDIIKLGHELLKKQGVELEPMQKLKLQRLNAWAKPETLKKTKYALEKKNENDKITVGIAVKYMIDGAQKTMFDSKEMTLRRLSGAI